MGEFETILNADTALKNTLNFLLPRITDKRISGYFKCKYTINEEQIKFLLPTLNLLLLPLKITLNSIYHTLQISEFQATLNANAQLTKNTSHLFYHTSQIGEFEIILNANTALKATLNSLYHASQISNFRLL
mgnify:FL=1